MCHHILIYDKHNSIINYMLADLKTMDLVKFDYVIGIDCASSNRQAYYIKKLYAKLIWSLFKHKWFHELSGQQGCVIITNEAMIGLDQKDIKRLQKMGKRVIGLFIDPMKADYVTITRARNAMKSFDAIYTFDPSDAKEFGLRYTNQLYSQIKPKAESTNEKSDLYYIGHVKGREAFIDSLVERGNKYGATLNIQLVGADKQDKISSAGIRYLSERKPYETVVGEISSAKCILDITQEGQTGITLRYYEAVVYNKKLITNNINITRLPYYDDRFMKVYRSIDDIDWSWIMNNEEPDYHYAGDFSPAHLMERIDKDD